MDEVYVVCAFDFKILLFLRFCEGMKCAASQVSFVKELPFVLDFSLT